MKEGNMKQFLDSLTSDPKFQLAMLEEGLIHRVGLRVMEFRKMAGLSQKALASALGTKQPRIARIEAGEANITLRALAQLAFVMRCAPEDFVVEHPSYVAATSLLDEIHASVSVVQVTTGGETTATVDASVYEGLAA